MSNINIPKISGYYAEQNNLNNEPEKPKKNEEQTKEVKHRQNVRKNNDFDPSRRKFIKNAGKLTLLTGSFLLGVDTGNNINNAADKLIKFFNPEDNKNEFLSKKEKNENESKKSINDQEILNQESENLLEVEDEYEENQVCIIEMLKDAFKDNRKIEFNKDTVEKIKNYWKNRYRNDPKLRKSFIEAYNKIGEWKPFLEKIFEDEGVPKEYMYLAIPESHWDLRAKSSAGAAGPYQFIVDTGKKFDLRRYGVIDERLDPLLSGEACAKLLKRDLYERTKDWNLALSGYNGGIINSYIKDRRSKGKKINYVDYLEYLEKELNRMKNDCLKEQTFKYAIKKNETLSKIAKKFDVKESVLISLNNIKNGKLQKGQKLKIPKTKKSLEKSFNRKIRFIVENLNYPGKFNAIIELINEGFVHEQEDPIKFRYIRVEQSKKTKPLKVSKDKTLAQLAKDIKVNPNELIAANSGRNISKLRKGQIIRIPDSKISLTDIAKHTNNSIDKLGELNPAILNARAPLPNDYLVRVAA